MFFRDTLFGIYAPSLIRFYTNTIATSNMFIIPSNNKRDYIDS